MEDEVWELQQGSDWHDGRGMLMFLLFFAILRFLSTYRCTYWSALERWCDHLLKEQQSDYESLNLTWRTWLDSLFQNRSSLITSNDVNWHPTKYLTNFSRFIIIYLFLHPSSISVPESRKKQRVRTVCPKDSEAGEAVSCPAGGEDNPLWKDQGNPQG